MFYEIPLREMNHQLIGEICKWFNLLYNRGNPTGSDEASLTLSIDTDLQDVVLFDDNTAFTEDSY